jgi:hypothetical protein
VKLAELNASPGASRLKRLVDSFVLGILGREAVTAAMHYTDGNAIQIGQTTAV